MEEDLRGNNSHNLFRMVRELEAGPRKHVNAVKDKNGNILCKNKEVIERWREHFNEHLNREFPHDEAALDTLHFLPVMVEEVENITEDEVRDAVARLKNRKAPGQDMITGEVLKKGGATMIKVLHRIFCKVWSEESTPSDWSRLLLTPVHKKGDRLQAENHRAITLNSIPGKVFCRIILCRIQTQIEEFTGDSQFGFRPGRGTVDAIFVVRQIMEKARERGLRLHFNFIDFKAAFDTIWRKALWMMLNKIGIPNKIVSILKSMYQNTECAVMIEGSISKWFRVDVGVRQGCLLSPVLFNVFLEFVMMELHSLDRALTYADDMSMDVRYADDTTLLSAMFEKLQLSTTELEVACARWGMRINVDKCKVLSENDGQVYIAGAAVEKVNNFVFLGSVVPGTSGDVKRRVALASSAFGRLRKSVWSRREVSLRLKVRIFECLINPIAIYASESWTLRAEDNRELLVFEMRCLRSILGVTRLDRLRNDDIRERLGIRSNILDTIKERRLRWFGHVVRRPSESILGSAYAGDFAARRPRGSKMERPGGGRRRTTLETLRGHRERKRGLEGVGWCQTQSKGPLWPAPLSQVKSYQIIWKFT